MFSEEKTNNLTEQIIVLGERKTDAKNELKMFSNSEES